MRAIRTFIAVACAWLALGAPVQAQSYFFPAPGGGGAVANPTNRAFEHLGLVQANGRGTQFNTGGTHTKGSWSPALGTTTAALSAIRVQFNVSAGARYIIDLSTDGSTANLFPDLLVVTSPGQVVDITLPLKVPAGSTIYARAQSTGSGSVVNMSIAGLPAAPGEFPGFDTVEKILAPNNAATRGNAGVSAAIGPSAPAFAEITASTSQAYGAFLIVPTGAGVSPSLQELIMDFATGPSDAVAHRWPLVMNNNATNDATRGQSPIIYKSVPAGQRLAYRAWGPTNAGAQDSVLAAVYGFR